jgi:DNA-binding NarL/FixJ family response regulator
MIRNQQTAAPATGRAIVLIIEGHPLVAELLAEALKQRPNVRVAAVVRADSEALDLVSQHRPDVLLVDLSRDARSAFGLLKRLRSTRRPPRTVLLDDRVHVAHVREGLRLGAKGYHAKHEPVAAIAAAIRRAADGEWSFCPEVARHINDTAEGPRLLPAFRYTPLETLTSRELDVLMQIVQGATVKECAEDLNLSPSTVDNHKSRLMRKLNIHRTVELVRMAIREQLIPS